jgi:hypothetical protein
MQEMTVGLLSVSHLLYSIVSCYGRVILSDHKAVICWHFHSETPQSWGLPNFVVLNSAAFSIQTPPQYVQKKITNWQLVLQHV